MAPLASHAALASGWGLHPALMLAAIQALGVGVLLWGALTPGRTRALAPAASLLLLAALVAGASRSPADGLAALAGALHGLIYAGLLWLFGHTLLPGRVALVTSIAIRINPWYHEGMRGYTRAVTVAWSVFFGGQLLASAVLGVVRPDWWLLLVGTLHAPLVLAMAAGEYAVRRRCFPEESAVSVMDSLRAVRRLNQQGGAAP